LIDTTTDSLGKQAHGNPHAFLPSPHGARSASNHFTKETSPGR
jgi:hypothetical protein